jgi:hypothetical protein
MNAIHNRSHVPAFLINSLPKAGTHLVGKAAGLFPGIHFSGIHIGKQARRTGGLMTRIIARLRLLPIDRSIYQLLLEFEGLLPKSSSETMVPIGIVQPRLARLSTVECILRWIDRGSFATAHIPFSQALSDVLKKNGMRMILVLRDPRDVVISQAKYVTSRPWHFLFEHYRGLSESEQIRVSITGIRSVPPHGERSLSISERLQIILPWMQEPFTYVTRFEKLVGPQGGGSREEQVQELRNIATHLHIHCSQEHIERIADSIFGGTATFRRGIIGNWRSCFTEEHKRLFKEVAGQFLIDMGYEEGFDW